MRKWILTPLLVALTLPCLSVVAMAGSNPDAVLALHIGTRESKNPCNTVQVPLDCASYVTKTNDSGLYNIYLTVSSYDTVGVAGVQFGINYENAQGMGCDMDGWTMCGDLQFPSTDWPQGGSGNLMTWNPVENCQTGTVTGKGVLVGVFSVTTYSGDVFSIVPRPVDGKAKVADCLASENDLTDLSPSRLGYVVFGTGTGYNPCSVTVATEKTTWGSIKTLYDK